MFELEYVLDRPMAGEATEVNFGTGCDLLWVRFRDQALDEWIGKFDLGNTFGKKIDKIDDDTAIVLANGNVYLVDVPSRSISKTIEGGYYYGFCIDKSLSRIVIDDALRLYVFDFEGNLIRRTKRFSLDGIEFNNCSGGVVQGRHNDCTEDWGTFSYNFVDDILECSWSME